MIFYDDLCPSLFVEIDPSRSHWSHNGHSGALSIMGFPNRISNSCKCETDQCCCCSASYTLISCNYLLDPIGQDLFWFPGWAMFLSQTPSAPSLQRCRAWGGRALAQRLSAGAPPQRQCQSRCGSAHRSSKSPSLGMTFHFKKWSKMNQVGFASGLVQTLAS